MGLFSIFSKKPPRLSSGLTKQQAVYNAHCKMYDLLPDEEGLGSQVAVDKIGFFVFMSGSGTVPVALSTRKLYWGDPDGIWSIDLDCVEGVEQPQQQGNDLIVGIREKDGSRHTLYFSAKGSDFQRFHACMTAILQKQQEPEENYDDDWEKEFYAQVEWEQKLMRLGEIAPGLYPSFISSQQL